MHRPCIATTSDGVQCSNWALRGGDYCFFHAQDEATQAARKEASSRGGKATRTEHSEAEAPAQVRSAEEVYQLLDYTLAETVTLENSVNRSRTLVALAQAYAALLTGVEIEQRLAKLEEIAASRRGTR